MVAPRDAATVILARPLGDGGYEVLLTRRPETMAFMGGAYVFPGGTLDAEDCAEHIESLSAITPAEARERLAEDIPPEQALGLFCCALRELFEEVGVLLARRGADPVDPVRVRDVYAPRQAEIGSDAATFARFLREERLTLATDLLVPHGRLITPEMSPLRFDARFFVAPFPEGQEVVPDPVEVPEWLWRTPTDAIREAGEARLQIPIPTMAILQGLADVPGYEQLLRGDRSRKEIHAGQLSPLVSHVLAPNPGLATGPGTNTYIVGHGDVAVIDPAVPDPVYIERLSQEIGKRGRARLVLLTHLHPDHIGGVGVFADQMRCEIAAWEGCLDEAPYVTRPVRDGEQIAIGGTTLQALHTPGHASHHLCYLLEEERSLFAGDVVSGLSTVVIAPPDGNMRDYLATLQRLKEAGLGRIYPGHGPVVEDGVAKLDEYIAHRRDRERQVIEALEAGHLHIPDMVTHVYTDVSPNLHKMAEMSVLAHLEMLEAQGRAVRDGDGWRLSGKGAR